MSLRGAFLRRALLLGSGVGLLLFLVGRNEARDAVPDLAEYRAGAVSEALVSALGGASARAGRQMVRALDAREDLEVVLTGVSGRPVEGGIEGVPADRLPRWGVAETGTELGYAYVARTLPPPRQGEGAIVAVRLADRTAGTRLRSLAIVILAFLSLATIASVLVSRELGLGIEELGGRIRAMATGAAAVTEVPITSRDELGELERAFNRLCARYRVEQQRFAESQVVLDQVDRYKSDFLATVSHELRTPLNSILGFSQVLLEGIDGRLSAGQAEDVRTIEQSGNHLLGLISDILDLSAMESGRIDLSRAPTDVGEIAVEVVRSAEGQLRGKPLRLATEIDPGAPRADADPKRVRQVLLNLVSNAIKFTDKGEVVVSVGREAGGVEVRVRDTGSGIPAGELETIFEEYRQLGETVRRRRGTGLGLTICKRLVELHGGSIRVESAVGKGSAFVVMLPPATEVRS